jgi:hypothetical protein
MVLVVSSLPPNLSVRSVRRFLDVIRRNHRLAENAQDAVAVARQTAADWPGLPPEEALEAAFDICLYLANAPG